MRSSRMIKSATGTGQQGRRAILEMGKLREEVTRGRLAGRPASRASTTDGTGKVRKRLSARAVEIFQEAE